MTTEKNEAGQGMEDNNTKDLNSASRGPEAAKEPGTVPSESKREDNRDEYYYPQPRENARFEGTQQKGQTPPATDQPAPSAGVRYDYYKSYPSYGPGAPYGDHERGAENNAEETTNE